MTNWVSGDEAVRLQYKLEMFFRVDIALSPLLGAIISTPGFWSTASLACLLNTYRDGYIRNSQDDIDKAITTQTNTWANNNRSTLKEHARQTIENLLRQPGQGTQYQIWEGDWMIDECLCAMYDASSGSSGQ